MATLLAESWYPTRRACEILSVNRRTLQRRASAGLLQTRTADTGETEYLLGGDAATPATTRATRGDKAPQTPPHRDATPATGAASELVGALVASIERATRAELALEGALRRIEEVTAERDQARAVATDLGEAMRRRAVIVRDLARRVGALEGGR